MKGEVNLRAAEVAAGHLRRRDDVCSQRRAEQPDSIPPARQLLPVAIASDPAGARIEIEGIYSGLTPAVVKLQPGEYRVTLTLQGHQDFESKLKVAAGEPAALAAAMKSYRRSNIASAVQ